METYNWYNYINSNCNISFESHSSITRNHISIEKNKLTNLILLQSDRYLFLN